MGNASGRRPAFILFWVSCLAAAATLAYWRALSLPLISDDYLVIALGRSYFAPGGLAELFADSLYRCRAVFMLLAGWMYQLFGLQPFAYKLASLALHVANCALILAFGLWKPVGWRLAAAAALFFASYQGHQEAVIWFSAMPDQLALLFLLISSHVWARWLATRRPVWYCATLVTFLLALLSKESGVVVPAALLLMMLVDRRPIASIARAVGPFVLIAALYFLLSFVDRGSHLHYSDGTFALGLHAFPVLGRSLLRMLWISGFLAIAAVSWFGLERYGRLALLSLCGIVAGLVPYSFLTYMSRVPSRHTYLASASMAFLVAAGFWSLWEHSRRTRAFAIAAVVATLAGNVGYLWTRKHQQYVERAHPTERLSQVVDRNSGVLEVRCFDYPLPILDAAVDLRWKGNVRVRRVEPVRNGPCAPGTRFRFIGD